MFDEKGVIFLDESISKDESYRFKPVVRQDSYLEACKKPTIIGEQVAKYSIFVFHMSTFISFICIYIIILFIPYKFYLCRTQSDNFLTL